MSAEYSVEGKLNRIEEVIQGLRPSRDGYITQAVGLLRDYAERIEADESAVPAAEVFERPVHHDLHNSPMMKDIRFTGMPLPIGAKLYANPRSPDAADSGRIRDALIAAQKLLRQNHDAIRGALDNHERKEATLVMDQIRDALAAQPQSATNDGMQPSRLKPRMPISPLGQEDFCFCNNEISLQGISGGGAPEGYLGSIRLKVSGEYVTYVRQSAASPVGGPYAQKTCTCWTIRQRELCMDRDRCCSPYTTAAPSATPEGGEVGL